MELTQSQISEIISNYTSSSKGFITLQSLILFFMNHERKLFIKEDKDEDEQCYDFRSRHWYSHGFEFSIRIPRSRSGNSHPLLLGFVRRKQRACKVIQSLYTKGLTIYLFHHYIQKRESN